MVLPSKEISKCLPSPSPPHRLTYLAPVDWDRELLKRDRATSPCVALLWSRRPASARRDHVEQRRLETGLGWRGRRTSDHVQCEPRTDHIRVRRKSLIILVSKPNGFDTDTAF